MVNVTSVVDSWGQGSGMRGRNDELVDKSLFTLTGFFPGTRILVSWPVGPEVVKKELWFASKNLLQC